MVLARARQENPSKRLYSALQSVVEGRRPALAVQSRASLAERRRTNKRSPGEEGYGIMAVQRGPAAVQLFRLVMSRAVLHTAAALLLPSLLVIVAYAMAPEQAPAPLREPSSGFATWSISETRLRRTGRIAAGIRKVPVRADGPAYITPGRIDARMDSRSGATIYRRPAQRASGKRERVQSVRLQVGRDNFKLLVFYPERDCEVITKLRPELRDPIRGGGGPYPCYAYGFWSSGAAGWWARMLIAAPVRGFSVEPGSLAPRRIASLWSGWLAVQEPCWLAWGFNDTSCNGTQPSGCPSGNGCGHGPPQRRERLPGGRRSVSGCMLALAGVAAVCAVLGSYLYMGTAKPGLPTTIEVACRNQPAEAGAACNAQVQDLGFGDGAWPSWPRLARSCS